MATLRPRVAELTDRPLPRFPRMRPDRDAERRGVDTATLTRGLVEIPVAW